MLVGIGKTLPVEFPVAGFFESCSVHSGKFMGSSFRSSTGSRPVQHVPLQFGLLFLPHDGLRDPSRSHFGSNLEVTPNTHCVKGMPSPNRNCKKGLPITNKTQNSNHATQNEFKHTGCSNPSFLWTLCFPPNCRKLALPPARNAKGSQNPSIRSPKFWFSLVWRLGLFGLIVHFGLYENRSNPHQSTI